MREILFRGKDYKTGIWLEGSLINLDVQGGYVYISEPYESGSSLPPLDLVKMFSHLVKPETIGQYIGQTDKNGTKIFEGDILCMTINNEWTNNKELKIYYYVKFNDGMFATFHKYYEDGEFIEIEEDRVCKALIDVDKFEVVGNIYDNPELLTHQHEDKGE